jgi:hypothetical protein
VQDEIDKITEKFLAEVDKLVAAHEDDRMAVADAKGAPPAPFFLGGN